MSALYTNVFISFYDNYNSPHNLQYFTQCANMHKYDEHEFGECIFQIFIIVLSTDKKSLIFTLLQVLISFKILKIKFYQFSVAGSLYVIKDKLYLIILWSLSCRLKTDEGGKILVYRQNVIWLPLPNFDAKFFTDIKNIFILHK